MNVPKKNAIMQAYPLFSHAHVINAGVSASPSNGEGSKFSKAIAIKANLRAEKIFASI